MGWRSIRANYPILTQLKLESPDGLTPAATLAGGIPAILVPAQGNGIIDIPSDYAWAGYPKDLDRGYIQSWNFTVQRELPWKFTGQIGYVGTHSTRQLGLSRHQCRPGHRRRRRRQAAAARVRPHGVDRVPAARRIGAVPLDAGAAAAAVRRRPQPERELHPGEGQERQREQLVHAERPGAGVHRAATTRSPAPIAPTTSASPTSWELPFGPDRRWLKRRRRAFVHRRRVAGQQHDQHHERPTLQRVRRRHVAEPAGQQPDGGPGEARRRSSAGPAAERRTTIRRRLPR